MSAYYHPIGQAIMSEQGKNKPNARGIASVEADYPHVAEWVQACGWIEIGDQDWQGFVVRALHEGGMAFEEEGCRTLGEALAALEKGLAKWLKENC